MKSFRDYSGFIKNNCANNWITFGFAKAKLRNIYGTLHCNCCIHKKIPNSNMRIWGTRMTKNATSQKNRLSLLIRTLTVGLRISLSPPITGCHRVADFHCRFGITPTPETTAKLWHYRIEFANLSVAKGAITPRRRTVCAPH